MEFSPMSKNEYISHGIGIGTTKCSKEMWNLLALTNRCMFAFENGLDISRLPAHFDKSIQKAAEVSINQTVGGETVLTYMYMNSPWEFYHALRTNEHEHLMLDRKHKGGLQGLVKARCYAWAPGKLSKSESDFIAMHSQDYQI